MSSKNLIRDAVQQQDQRFWRITIAQKAQLLFLITFPSFQLEFSLDRGARTVKNSPLLFIATFGTFRCDYLGRRR